MIGRDAWISRGFSTGRPSRIGGPGLDFRQGPSERLNPGSVSRLPRDPSAAAGSGFGVE
jgi:hypothetical protein